MVGRTVHEDTAPRLLNRMRHHLSNNLHKYHDSMRGRIFTWFHFKYFYHVIYPHVALSLVQANPRENAVNIHWDKSKAVIVQLYRRGCASPITPAQEQQIHRWRRLIRDCIFTSTDSIPFKFYQLPNEMQPEQFWISQCDTSRPSLIEKQQLQLRVWGNSSHKDI